MNEIIKAINKIYPNMDVERVNVNFMGEPLGVGDDEPTEVEINIRLIRKQ